MTGPADDGPFRLDLVVRSVTWYDWRPDDGEHAATVGVRFPDNVERTVCEIPAARHDDPDGAAAAVVNAGKTFAFAVPPGGRAKPVRLAVRLCRAAGDETIASGELRVTVGRDGEHTVPMTDGRTTVAVLAVRARVWNAAAAAAASVEPPAWPESGRKVARCPARAACRRPRTVVVRPRPQRYTSIGCEIDGRRIDLRVRKNDYDTCAAQRQIAGEAEQFAARAVDMVGEMHGLITDAIIAKKCPADELAADVTL